MTTTVPFVQLATEAGVEVMGLRDSRKLGRLFERIGPQKRLFA